MVQRQRHMEQEAKMVARSLQSTNFSNCVKIFQRISGQNKISKQEAHLSFCLTVLFLVQFENSPKV